MAAAIAASCSFANAQSCSGLSSKTCRQTQGCEWDRFARSCVVGCPANVFQSTSPDYGVIDEFEFNLWLDLDLSRSDVQTFYSNAYSRWTSIIKSDSNNGGSTSTSGLNLWAECPAGIPSILDDLYICGRDTCIDGPGNVLGSAGPQYIWTATGLPATGIMEFDSEDIPNLLDLWEVVILHEMGHVLGIGSSSGWDDAIDTNNDFTGPNATDVWQNQWGCLGLPPIETDGGAG